MNSVYSATKAALRSFARTWTTDLRDRRIRVNAVSPGSIDTPGLSDLLASSETGEQRKKMISSVTPLGRLGTPDEIAKAVVFLASDDSSPGSGNDHGSLRRRSCNATIKLISRPTMADDLDKSGPRSDEVESGGAAPPLTPATWQPKFNQWLLAMVVSMAPGLIVTWR